MQMMRVGQIAIALLLSSQVSAADKKPLSPRGTAATQVGGKWANAEDPEKRHYEGGKWIEVDYGRPLLRGRNNIFGAGPNYGKDVNAGAPVWRAGANQTTHLKTEAALEMGGKKIPAGDYAVFVELKETGWTLILSTQKTADAYDPKDKSKIWGAYGYDPKFDVVRVPMKLSTNPASVDQFTILFEDVTEKSGKLTLLWDKSVAVVPFTVAE